jgi:hypothetical protein
MAYEVVRVVTQPFHGADGTEVLYSPGDRVPVDAELPHGVRTQLTVAEVQDKAAAPDKAPGRTPAKTGQRVTIPPA